MLLQCALREVKLREYRWHYDYSLYSPHIQELLKNKALEAVVVLLCQVYQCKEAFESQLHKCAEARELQPPLAGVTHQSLDHGDAVEGAIMWSDQADDLKCALEVDRLLVLKGVLQSGEELLQDHSFDLLSYHVPLIFED